MWSCAAKHESVAGGLHKWCPKVYKFYYAARTRSLRQRFDVTVPWALAVEVRQQLAAAPRSRPSARCTETTQHKSTPKV